MILLAAAVAGALVLVALVNLEERRRPDVAVFAIVGVTLLDAVLFPQQGAVPIGLFRPGIGGQDVRPADVLIVLALLARLLVHGLPRRVSAEGVVWTVFFTWWAFAAGLGIVRGQPTDLLLFQGKLVVQMGGMIAVVAGVPLHRLAKPSVVNRLAVVGGALGALVVLLAAAGTSIRLPFPSGAQLGVVHPDAATMLFTLGCLVLLSAVCRERLEGWVVAGGLAMASAPLVADQRAALAGALPTLLVIAAAMGGVTWRHRSRMRPAALLPLIAVVLVPVGFAAARAATEGQGAQALPLVARLSDTFGSTQSQQSSDIRLGLLRDGLALVRSRTVLGHGLGQPVQMLDMQRDAFVAIGDFHNIALDLAVRTGVSGLVLFALACTVSGMAAIRRWASIVSDAQAALVLAAGAALTGLLVKGLFETIFQKYRLAVLLGLLIGIIAAANRSPGRPRKESRSRDSETLSV